MVVGATADPVVIAQIRAKARSILDALERETEDDEELHPSWVRGGGGDGSFVRSSSCKFFDRHGFLHIKQFSKTETEVYAMKRQMEALASEWDPDSGKTSVFRTDEGQVDAQGSDDYFLTSSDRVHFFAEKDAIDADGKLKQKYTTNKLAALNKAGHGMHMIPGAFRSYCTSSKVRALVRELGWLDPVVPQSMYIFKQPHVGGEVTSHQDSTFLYTEPRQSTWPLWYSLSSSIMWIAIADWHTFMST